MSDEDKYLSELKRLQEYSLNKLEQEKVHEKHEKREGERKERLRKGLKVYRDIRRDIREKGFREWELPNPEKLCPEQDSQSPNPRTAVIEKPAMKHWRQKMQLRQRWLRHKHSVNSETAIAAVEPRGHPNDFEVSTGH